VGRIAAVDDRNEFIGKKFRRGLQPPLPVKPVNRLRRNLDGAGTGIQLLDIDLVGLVILGNQTDGIGLDTQIAVLGYEHDRHIRILITGIHGDGKDTIVTAVLTQVHRQMFEVFFREEHDPQRTPTRHDNPGGQ